MTKSRLNAGGVGRSCAWRGEGQWLVRGPAPWMQLGVRDGMLGYEHLRHGDHDFQDFVVLVRGVEPIPRPGAPPPGLAALRLRGRRAEFC